MRVCLDTNVLVAAFATRGLCADVLRTVLAEHELALGEVILTEFRRVLEQRLRVPQERITEAESVFEGVVIVAKPRTAVNLDIRDASDRWIVATAVAGEADVLVTGDADILAVVGDAPLPVLTPRGFWELLRSGI